MQQLCEDLAEWERQQPTSALERLRTAYENAPRELAQVMRWQQELYDLLSQLGPGQELRLVHGRRGSQLIVVDAQPDGTNSGGSITAPS